MPVDQRAALAGIRSRTQLVTYLRDQMGWPIEQDSFEDDLFFDFTPEELGIDPKTAAKIQEIKRLRPLSPNQPWGIFFIKFEPKKLPVAVLRRILGRVTLRKRASANSAERLAWSPNDLLFVSNYGEGESRQISFAHFEQPEGKQDLPTLKVLGWDNQDTALHLDAVAAQLTSCLVWPRNEQDTAAWRERWRSAFTLEHGQVISTAKELASRLAALARAIRDRIQAALGIETEKGPLTKMLRAFRDGLMHDLDHAGFADMYAQTIAYGLLSARIADPSRKTADELAAHMRTSPFLRELMATFLQLGGRQGKAGGPGIDFDELGVSDVVQLLDSADMEAVVRDFGDRNRQEDPVMHFYESFLAEYNKQLKIQRGVFYTPQPVVSYIVRSVHELLQTEFGLADGLADTTTWGEMLKQHPELKLPPLTDEPNEARTISPDEPFVQILDPATGTATFLVEVIEVIHQTLKVKWKQQRLNDAQQRAAWNEYVPQHLLPRLHAFELMMAPYAIAHMKIGLKLAETGYRFGTEERARIYLSNALEPWVRQLPLIGFDALAHEAAAVNEIKREKRFTVVIGNPPYSLYSANMTNDARKLVDGYRYVDGEKVKERGALQLEKNLQDDYVKFFAFSERRLVDSALGILAFISNQGYLGNKSLRGMRAHFLGSFNQITVLDLHGSVSRAKSDGDVDQNVFDIQQGVAVGIFRNSPLSDVRRVHYLELRGTRQSKYAHLSSAKIRSSNGDEVFPEGPDFFFLPFDGKLRTEYQRGFALTEVMPIYSSGMVTARDAITIWFDKDDLERFLRKFSKLDVETARKEFHLGEDTKDWSVQRARSDVGSGPWKDNLAQVLYRPFDPRWTFYTGQARGFLCNPRRPVQQHLRHLRNIALVTNRQVNNEFKHALVTRALIDTCTLSSATRETAYVFPLLVDSEGDLALSNSSIFANFSRTFLELFENRLGTPPSQERGSVSPPTADEFFFYIYAILSSVEYRARYASLLKVDFPRVPLTGNLDLFRALARLGGELTALHLVESPTLDRPLTKFVGSSREVVKVGWVDNTVWIDAGGKKAATTAGTSGFRGVPEAVWNFHIGGYQVCEKWLKDRKGRTLSEDDIAHYHKIVVALSETIRLMQEIDEVIDQHGGWPGAFAGAEAGAGTLMKAAEGAQEYRDR
jgi:predicted helicase